MRMRIGGGLALSLLCGLMFPSLVLSQIGVGGGIGGGLGGGAGGGLGGGVGVGNVGGILINADGVISIVDARRKSITVLRKSRADFLATHLTQDLATPAKERTISLSAVARQIGVCLADDTPIPESLLCLGGLTRIEHIILDREQRDVLISGPAEGFIPDDQGRRVGIESGRPTLWLEDLIVALRSRRENVRSIGCSIDPTPDNMARLQAYLRQNSSPTTTAGAQARFRQMDDVLGLQEVTVWGVPEDSHFARVLVEADYRMKRIAIGAEPSGVKGIRSHLSMLTPQGNTLQRWWFIPCYDPVQENEDHSVFAISGPRAQLMAQEEITDASGNRLDAPATRQSIEEFARQFSTHLPELAEKSPVFAELQNLFDMALLSALMDREGALQNANWECVTRLTDERLKTGGYAVPKYVKSQSTFKNARGGLLLGLVGGVTMNIDRAVRETQTSEIRPLPSWLPAASEANWWWNQSE